MKDSRMELQTEANCINRVISRILLFHYGDVIWWPFIYFFFYFRGRIYAQKPRNSIQHVPVHRVSLCDFFFSPFISYGGVHWISAATKNGTFDSLILFYVSRNWKGLATSFGHSRSFTAALIAGITAFSGFPPLWEEENWQLPPYRRSHRRYQLQFPAFPRFERRQTGSCSFTASLIGGKVDFPAFLLSQRRKTGNCSFTAALIGGKVDFPVFLLCERRKTGNCSFTASPIGGKVDFRFPPLWEEENWQLQLYRCSHRR